MPHSMNHQLVSRSSQNSAVHEKRGMRTSASFSVSCPKESITLCITDSPISCHIIYTFFSRIIDHDVASL